MGENATINNGSGCVQLIFLTYNLLFVKRRFLNCDRTSVIQCRIAHRSVKLDTSVPRYQFARQYDNIAICCGLVAYETPRGWTCVMKQCDDLRARMAIR
ncbi:hypothetical protein BBBOND_0302030 [Babesia bigemina]|uniref:Uncharacterized protein n=1 Tax=Babesia bigemina TaxID=5866 RepID=A0A061DBR3_BABBI|nr:hypothetical protein BBBOND_0302030 [Babesia bigemina]CDR96299.1 hypothetical protein BBBOND_0302030 [Babesia bigemina]|eukprot:XP_012768485.1 hypothetical protein BBBOND_0302030 [Babesia bigemina]